MKNHEIDAETIAMYMHEAQRLRAEVLTEWLVACGSRLKKSGNSLRRLAHSLARRGKWNLSVPAPHR